jgi:hypothetical protein
MASRVTLPEPVLLLTGERADGRLTVIVSDKPVTLSCNQFRMLVHLILARGSSATGFLANPRAFYPEAVCRLRKAIDRGAGHGVGRALIETGAGSEYRLALPLDKVALKVCSHELADARVLATDELVALQNLVRTT